VALSVEQRRIALLWKFGDYREQRERSLRVREDNMVVG
jgi:hypothetical protein